MSRVAHHRDSLRTYFDVALQGTRLILFILIILSGCFLVAAA